MFTFSNRDRADHFFVLYVIASMPPIHRGTGDVIGRRRSRRRTTYRERYNSLSASDVQLRNLIQAAWAAAIQQTQRDENRLRMALLLDIDVFDKDIFMALLFRYRRSRELLLLAQSLDSWLMNITQDQIVPRLPPVAQHRSFNLLHPDWCLQYTRLKIDQLRELHRLLRFPLMIDVGDQNRCTSEEALIITLVKLTQGFTLVHCKTFFGEATDSRLSKIF